MRPRRLSLCLQFTISLAIAFCAAAVASAADDYTPLVVSKFPSQVYLFPGTDGKQHLVYELLLTNALSKPVPLQKLEVLDEGDRSKVLGSYDGAALQLQLRNISASPSQSTEIEVNGSRIFFIEMEFAPGAAPTRLTHRLTILAASRANPTAAPAPESYTAAPINVVSNLPKIGAPLAGTRWVALNGCCSALGAHRSTGLPVNGDVYFAQRFAIDWMKLDDQGRLVHGDDTDVHNYTSYGANIIAVADGTVVRVLKTLDDQKPPHNPDPKTINLENVTGNYIVTDIGNGVFAFYAHMQKGSIVVNVGDRVRRGQVLGHLGNTGNSSAPHLHFHLMDGPSVLGSSGIPYVIDSFAVAGKVPGPKFNASPTVDGSWSEDMLPTPSPRQKEFPMDFTIVDF